MNILSKVTRKTLLRNKVRTIVTIIGIILSAAMITAVTSSVSSFEKYLQNVMIAQDGLWHGSFNYMPASDRERLEGDSKFDSAAYAQIVGYAGEAMDPEASTPYLYVLGGDAAFYERMPVTITEGRLPENPQEIVLNEQAAYGDLYWDTGLPAIGSTITLELGDRYLDGELLDIYIGYTEGEELRPRQTRTYTVVGYMERPGFEDWSNPGYMAFTVYDETVETPYLDCWFLLKDPADIFDFQRDFPAGAYTSNDNADYLMTLGVVRYDNFFTVLYALAAILIGLIMFGSVSLIYNAFSISVAERTKQFGLLRSVGATKKQIRRMVFEEAVIVSAIGIPLGILSGILGMTVTFRFIGADLARLYNYRYNVTLGMHVSLASVLIAAAIGFVTVLISAWVPSRRAMRVSAIEAIRQSGDVSIKKREVRTSRLTYRLFGLEGAIASKHFKRSRRRYRATVVSLFMSVVLFISASSFCRYLTDSVSGVFETYDYEISLSWSGSTRPTDDSGEEFSLEEVAELLKNAEGVNRYTAVRYTNTTSTFPLEALSDELSLSYEELPEEGYTINVWLYGLDEASYRQYLKEQGLRESDLIGTDQVIVFARTSFFNSETERMETVSFFKNEIDSITVPIVDEDALLAFYDREDLEELTDEEYEAAREACYHDVIFAVGASADELPFGLGRRYDSGVKLIMSMETFLKVVDEADCAGSLYFGSDDHERTYDAMQALCEDAGINTGLLQDVYAVDESSRSIITIIKVLSYGFITLISLIAAANVFNTISTNVLLRRREFAMLRSVGMTSKGFDRMMSFECVLYGTKSLLYGIPAAFGVTYLIFRSIQLGMDTSFYLPWSAVLIAVGSVFLVVFATMMYSMGRVKRDNPIEALRSEVI